MAAQERATTVESSESGLEPNVLGALSYVLWLLTGLVVYLLEPNDEFVRFHAAQSMVFSAIVIGVGIVFTVIQTVFFSVGFFDPAGFILWSIVSLIMTLVSLVFWLASLAAWLYLVVRAYQGKTPRLPIAARFADRLV
ncbi:DUF4870 domain-containing protein [Halomarina salina]|uniref:DUF4870 domain-containing protein n=1 Tax=Halomarina salina TaxID=1872699 RepID=A0ABD5RPG3_9EURY|nr:DUF4870 domain-containing protein [Halomarina salina]